MIGEGRGKNWRSAKVFRQHERQIMEIIASSIQYHSYLALPLKMIEIVTVDDKDQNLKGVVYSVQLKGSKNSSTRTLAPGKAFGFDMEYHRHYIARKHNLEIINEVETLIKLTRI